METLIGGLHWLLTAAWLGALLYCLPLYRVQQVPMEHRAGFFAAYSLLRLSSLVPLAVGIIYWLLKSQDSREVVTSWGTTFQAGLLLAALLVVNQWSLLWPQVRRLADVSEDDPGFDEIARRLFLGARFSLVLGGVALLFLGSALVFPLAPGAGSGQLGNYWALVVLAVSLFEGMAWFLENDRPMQHPLSLVVDLITLSALLVGATFIA